MIQAGAGALALLALLPISRPVAADPVRGEQVFQRCYACHSVGTGEERLTGPSLRCVVGRRAGTLAGFELSAAMLAAGSQRGLVWTRETLEAFPVDPQLVVAGTAMWIPSLPAAQDRQDLIDYLERAVPCPVEPPPARP